MKKQLTTQQSLTPEQAEAVAAYQIELEQWNRTRQRLIVSSAAMIGLQVPLWVLSYLAASFVDSGPTWALGFSLVMFAGATIFGIVFIVTTTTYIFATPPRRPNFIQS